MLRTRPLADSVGAEVMDFSLAQPLDAQTRDELRLLLAQRGVLLFRQQKLSEAQHIAFSRHFGDLEIHVLKQYLMPGHPEILLVSNVLEDGKPVGVKDAGQYWHTDLSYLARPSASSVLHAREIPDRDGDRTFGDTCFVSTAMAYEALDDEMKQRLASLTATHHYEARYRKLQSGNSYRPDLTQEQKNKVPPVVHPVIRTHPVSKQRCIYVNEGFTSEIVGLPQAESDRLLGWLFEHCTQQRFMYRHRWSVGDVVMWDNCSTQHLAIADYQWPQRRMMHRTTIAGQAVC